MGNLRDLVPLVVLLSTTTYAQNQYGQQIIVGSNQGRGSGSPCLCTQQYIPFCASDGTREITFSNKCSFECARSANPRLRIRFEGVCAKPYVDSSGSTSTSNQNSGSWQSSNQYRPQPITTRRPSGRYEASSSNWVSRPQTTTQSPYRPQYPVQSGYRPEPTTTRRPQYPSYPSREQTEYRPEPTTTRRSQYPSSGGYGAQPTSRPTQRPRYPSLDTSDYQPQESRPSPEYRPSPYQTTTTNRPWWENQRGQTRYPTANSANYVAGYGSGGRKSRNIFQNSYSSDGVEGDDDYEK